MINIGSKIPDMQFEAFQGDDAKKLSFASFKNKWLVLIFYPADFTFVCPTELEEAAERYEEFKKLGAEVLSISTDKVETHKAWHDTSEAIKKIEYPMVADPTTKIAKEFGVYIEEEGVALRGTFIVDPDGILRTMEVHHNSIGRNITETLRKLQAAIYVRKHGDQVCPASWEPGDKTLKPGMDLVGKI